MERLRLKTETDKASKKMLSKLENNIKAYKEKQNKWAMGAWEFIDNSNMVNQVRGNLHQFPKVLHSA